MGSGCDKNSGLGMECNPRVYDACVFYTGEPIPELDICRLDPYKEIMSKILAFMLKPDAEYTFLDKCEKLKLLIGDKAPTIVNIVEVLTEVICEMDARVETLEEAVFTPSFMYDLKCLILTTDAKTEEIVQKLIDLYCESDTRISKLESRVDTIFGKIEDSTGDGTEKELVSITAEHEKNIVKTGVGEYLIRGLVKPYMPMPYIGPLTNFDSSGKGIATKGFKDWYIMNGLNGTQDWRGFTFASATNVPGTALSPLTDPSIIGTEFSTSIGSTKGLSKMKLSPVQVPDHTHLATSSVNDNGHSHRYFFGTKKMAERNVGVSMNVTETNNGLFTTYYDDKVVGKSYTGISVSTVVNNVDRGGIGQAYINLLQPTKYGVWIVWIP